MEFKMNPSEGEYEFSLCIRNYRPAIGDDQFDSWCKVDLKIKCRDYMDYKVLNDEMLESADVEKLAWELARLLNGDISEETLICFTEPDLNFTLYPKQFTGNFEADISAELMISLRRSDTNYNGLMLTIPMDRDDIIALLLYLKEVMENGQLEQRTLSGI